MMLAVQLGGAIANQQHDLVRSPLQGLPIKDRNKTRIITAVCKDACRNAHATLTLNALMMAIFS